MAWEPDRRSNFFSPPAHLCAVTYMTEISLIVTSNNQFTLPYLTKVTLTSRFSKHTDIDFSLFMNGLKCGFIQVILDA